MIAGGLGLLFLQPSETFPPSPSGFSFRLGPPKPSPIGQAFLKNPFLFFTTVFQLCFFSLPSFDRFSSDRFLMGRCSPSPRGVGFFFFFLADTFFFPRLVSLHFKSGLPFFFFFLLSCDQFQTFFFFRPPPTSFHGAR